MVAHNLQKDEMTEILEACRRLSHILDPESLYGALADLIKKRFAVRELALLLIARPTKTFHWYSAKVSTICIF